MEVADGNNAIKAHSPVVHSSLLSSSLLRTRSSQAPTSFLAHLQPVRSPPYPRFSPSVPPSPSPCLALVPAAQLHRPYRSPFRSTKQKTSAPRGFSHPCRTTFSRPHWLSLSLSLYRLAIPRVAPPLKPLVPSHVQNSARAMAKHVYPPWHSLVQKILFAVAAILCITIPVIYGQRQSISSTAVIAVLLLYFAGWAAFSLGVRFGLPSRMVESTLPVHTPTPAPPVIRHAPASRSALPIAPAIKISLPNSPTPCTTDSAVNTTDSSTGAIALETRPQRPGARFVDSDGATFEESDPQETKGVQNTAVVTFQARPRAMTGDSINSAVYPTYATYRQAQHGNFDAFAQRIRRALESAKAENRLQQQRQEQGEQEELETRQVRAQSIPDHTISSHEERSEKKLLSALSAAHSRQLMDATETESIASATGSLSSLSATKTTGGGRPRSSSAASIISNLSEKIRIGSTTLFGRTGRSRAGSDASVMVSTATGPVSGVGNASTILATATATPAVPSSEQSRSRSVTTTMAAMASAAAVASAMTIPRSSAMDAATHNIPYGPAQPQARRANRHSAIMHPLAKASYVKDDDDDNNSEHDESPEWPEGGNVSRTEILAADQERSSH